VSKALEDKTDAHVRRFKPYPAYKDSGVEWLGKVPVHWEVKRVRTIWVSRAIRLFRRLLSHVRGFNSSLVKKADKKTHLHVHEKNSKIHTVNILRTARLIELIERSGTDKQGDR
jgi:hypothetical protein